MMVEVIHNDLDILEVTPAMVADLKKRALASERKRSRLCMHHCRKDATQEMLIVFHEATYMPPHRHPQGKSESYHIVEGMMKVFFFDDEGVVIRSIEMSAPGSGKAFLYRLSARVWHMPVAMSEWLVYHETYTGPFEKEVDVEFPGWAPAEEDKEGARKFMEELGI